MCATWKPCFGWWGQLTQLFKAFFGKPNLELMCPPWAHSFTPVARAQHVNTNCNLYNADLQKTLMVIPPLWDLSLLSICCVLHSWENPEKVPCLRRACTLFLDEKDEDIIPRWGNVSLKYTWICFEQCIHLSHTTVKIQNMPDVPENSLPNY